MAGLIWGAGSIWITPHPHAGTLDLYYLSLIMVAMMAAANLESLDRPLLAFAWGVAVSALLCIPQSFGWSPVPQGHAPAGLFYNSEILAETAAPLVVWAFWTHRWALMSILAVPVVLGQSRVSMIVVAAGLIYGARIPRWTKWICAAILPCVGLALLVALGPDKFQGAYVRIGLWGTALWSIVPFGRGVGWWMAAHPSAMQMFAHSDVLQLMVEFGIGAVPLLLLPFVIMRRRRGSVAQRAAYVGLSIECLISFPMHFPATSFLLGILAGFLARVGHDGGLAEHESTGDLRGNVRWAPASAGLLPRWLGAGDRGVPVGSEPAGRSALGA